MSESGNGHGKKSERASRGEPRAPALDPIYDVPLIGRLVKEADALRTRLPLGKEMAAGEAELLRAEARALRLAANYLETRARLLDRARREGAEPGERPVRRVQVD